MDELDKKKSILLKNKYHILRMPNNKKKVEMLNAYFSLLHYYKTIIDNDEIVEKLDIDDEFTKKYDRYIISDTSKRINEVEKYAPMLYGKFKQIIDIYKENDFCTYEYISANRVNKAILSKALWDFFASLGDDVLNIYRNMILGDNILLNNTVMERLGYSINSNPIDNACIVIQNIPNYLDFYTTLAHEVGHCYQFYLKSSSRNYAMFDPYCEITSMLFEKMFVEYLKNNYIIKDTSSIDLEDHVRFINSISISKSICKMLINKKIGIINPYDLSYTCCIKEDDIKKEIINDCGYIEPYGLKPELIEIHYSFGDIISRYFMKKFENDFDVEWHNFKDFICTVEYIPMNEVIEEYFDIDSVKDEVKKLTKSYRER